IVLQDNVCLHLDDNALVLFTADHTLYPIIDTSFEGLETRRCQAPISARGAKNIAITGRGVMDGNGDTWRPVKKNKLTDAQLVNLSINQTLPRSIITTATTVTAMISVSIVCALMGTTSILTFSIPLAIGMLIGFYSSVCLAGPLWIWVQEIRSKKKAAKA
ncbi:MAG: hypothetical protein ACI4WS_11325, partial [Oscillospiraceae bacterium]